MQIITRAHLFAFLTGPSMDPEQVFATEMTAFANAILADSPTVQYFIYTDSENGDDPEVAYTDGAYAVSSEIVPQQDTDNGYYGAGVSHTKWNPERRIYGCFLGGCSAMSAAGFTLSTATLVG